MFDFISASDLIVLGIAAVVTAVVIGLVQWWQSRSGAGNERSTEET